MNQFYGGTRVIRSVGVFAKLICVIHVYTIEQHKRFLFQIHNVSKSTATQTPTNFVLRSFLVFLRLRLRNTSQTPDEMGV